MKHDWRESLREKGWVETSPGNWSQANRIVRRVETDSTKQTPSCTLEKRNGERPKSAKSVGAVLRVRMVAQRKRLIDRDAIAFSMKPLTDAVAAFLRVDDDDKRVEWEWGQVKTEGKEGVIVIVEELI